MTKPKQDDLRLAEAETGGLAEGEESLDQKRDRIWAAWREAYRSPVGADTAGWVEEVYDDHVIANLGQDHYSIDFADDGENVTFDSASAKKVERTWVVAEARGLQFLRPLAEADGSDPTGTEWEVVLIEAGVSQNGYDYTKAVLKKALPLFEGVRVMLRSDEDHLAGRAKSVENVVGWIDGVKMVGSQVRGTLHLSEAADKLRTLLTDAWNRGKKDIAGLSIVGAASGFEPAAVVEGKRVKRPKGIAKVSSVDVVYDAAAGGRFTDLVAAVAPDREEESVDRLKKLIEAALAKGDAAVVKGLVEALDDEDSKELKEAAPDLWTKIEKVLAEAAKDEPVDKPAPKTEPKADDKKLAEAKDEDLVPPSVARFVIREALAETKLPDVVKTRITKRFAAKALDETELTEAISDELATWAELEKAQLVRSNGSTRTEVTVGIEEAELAKAALDGFFLGEASEIDGEKVKPYRSFKQAYIDLTGDGLKDGVVTGRLPRIGDPIGKLGISEANGGRVRMHLHEADGEGGLVLSEAIATTGFTEILGDSITRRMVAEYARTGLDTWRGITDVVPVTDFRTQRRMRFGGYANLAAVAQGAAYVAMTSPTDEEATYAATKRGGTETINLEAIANDDVGFIRRIPTRMARAAAQTLHEFVFQFLNANAAIYDAVALFHATHNNLGSVALSTASLSAALQRMRKQTELDNAKRLGIVGRHLYVPIDLEETAFVLTASERKQGTADNDASFVKAKGIDYEVVDYWTDTNNWYLASDRSDTPLIEVGFYGPEEPELFVQDMPNVGSMFTNDQATYKIRHSYGGAVVDFRGLDGSVVA